MIYVVDTCVFRNLLTNVYRSVNPEIWDSFEDMLSTGEIVSVKEAYKELELQLSKNGTAYLWLKKYKSAFHNTTNNEAKIVRQIYSIRNFQNGVKEQNICNGRPVADAFIVAKAKVLGGIVVTREQYSPHAAKIPNICEVFNVKCMGEEEFQLILKGTIKTCSAPRCQDTDLKK